MVLKDKLYNYVVRKNDGLRYEYERYVMEHIDEHKKSRFKHWKLLGRLFVHYRIKNKRTPLYYTCEPSKMITTSEQVQSAISANNIQGEKAITKAKEPVKEKVVAKTVKMQVKEKAQGATKDATFNFPYPEIDTPESKCYNQIPPHQFVKRLLQYDVISFDVFDTLLLRSISEPKSVYTLIGERLNYLSFQRVRIRAQSEAREKCIRTKGTNEMSLEDIYEVVFNKTGIPVDIGVKAEMNVEKDICYANPYMKRVFDILQSYGKRIIITSDMYMSQKQIHELLECAGYQNISEIYVSSEYGCSKANGQLFNIIIENEGYDKRIIHVGDNPKSDIKNAKEKNIAAAHYTNVNTAGNKYRCDGMSQLMRAAYRGIVNAQLHCGINKYSFPYEFGFVYVEYIYWDLQIGYMNMQVIMGYKKFFFWHVMVMFIKKYMINYIMI